VASNPLSTWISPIQPIQLKPIKPIQSILYIFVEMLTTYPQHERLKHVTLFFEQATLVVGTWFQTLNNLAYLKTKYNIVENLLKGTNNQLQACCLELDCHKQALHNKNNDLTTMKTQFLKPQVENKHLVTKNVEAERAIKKVKAL
jgi:hypothetical protein